MINILGNASKLKGELEKAGKNVTSFSDKIGKIGKVAAVAGVAITAAFTAVVLKTAAVGDQFDKMSLRTGIAVEDLSSLAYAADICGSDIGTMEKGLKALTKVMDDASRGIGEGLDAFRELDIAVTDTEGNLRSTVDVLKEAATKISAIEDPTKQAAYAMDLFGSRAGPQLLPLLKMGEAGIDELMKKAKELGITITTEAATAAAEFTDRMTDLKGSLAGAGRMIGDTLIPAITPLIEKATEIVVKIKAWAEENSELVEKIFKWAAALGVTLAVLGPILIILPSLITGVTLLSGAFLPFVATGAIVLGIMKLSEYLRETVGGMREFREELGKMELDAVDAEIRELTDSLEQMQKKFYEIPEGFFGRKRELSEQGQMYLTMMDEMNKRLEMLYKRREELTKAEEEGIDVTKEKIKLDEEVEELLETLAQKEEELRKELEAKAKAAELANAQMEIENKLFALEHNAYEVAERDLDLLKQAYLDKGIAQEIVDEWHDLEIAKLGELNKKLDENKGIMEEVASATKAVEDRWFALTHLPYEVKIKEINEGYDKYIKLVEESTLSDLAKETAIRNATIARDKEIEGVDKLTESEKRLTDATKDIRDRTLELTDSLAYNILKLDEQKEMFEKAGVAVELITEWYEKARAALEEPPDIDPWKEFFDNLKEKYSDTAGAIQSGISNFVSIAETALGDAFYNILSGAESFGDSMRGLFKSIVDAVIRELARLAAFYVFKWIFKIPLLKGGGVGYDLGGQVKRYQAGGGVDTVLARLTVGEYVIAKPMTDFIRKFKAFPANLIEAISAGIPTPAPAFASGGLVSSPNVTTSGFGETRINIDIHDNRIASDIDIKRLASTIGDEVLRKIEMKRRY